MANCSSEKDTLLDQIASLETKISDLEKENSQLKSYIKFLQNKLHSLTGSDETNDIEEITPVEDEDAESPEDEDTSEGDEYKDFD